MSINNSILVTGFTFGSIYLFTKHYEFTMKTLHNKNKYIFTPLHILIADPAGRHL
jgi:hypothetical protein